MIGLLAAGSWAADAIMLQSTDVPDSMGALDYMDEATSYVSPKGVPRTVFKLGVKGGRAIAPNITVKFKNGEEGTHLINHYVMDLDRIGV